MAGPPSKRSGRDTAPPSTLNACLTLVVLAAMVAMQALAARAGTRAGVLGAGAVFAAALLTLNALIHEAEHRMLASRPALNDGLGIAVWVMTRCR